MNKGELVKYPRRCRMLYVVVLCVGGILGIGD